MALSRQIVVPDDAFAIGRAFSTHVPPACLSTLVPLACRPHFRASGVLHALSCFGAALGALALWTCPQRFRALDALGAFAL
jgi:hypothetical protein